jgi:hypothetical protein
VVLLAEVENLLVHCKITAATTAGRGGFALLQVTPIIPLLFSPSVVLSSNTTGEGGVTVDASFETATELGSKTQIVLSLPLFDVLAASLSGTGLLPV